MNETQAIIDTLQRDFNDMHARAVLAEARLANALEELNKREGENDVKETKK